MQNRIKVLRELKDISQGKLAEQCMSADRRLMLLKTTSMTPVYHWHLLSQKHWRSRLNSYYV